MLLIGHFNTIKAVPRNPPSDIQQSKCADRDSASDPSVCVNRAISQASLPIVDEWLSLSALVLIEGAR